MFRLPPTPYWIVLWEKKMLRNCKLWTISKIRSVNIWVVRTKYERFASLNSMWIDYVGRDNSPRIINSRYVFRILNNKFQSMAKSAIFKDLFCKTLFPRGIDLLICMGPIGCAHHYSNLLRICLKFSFLLMKWRMISYFKMVSNWIEAVNWVY